MKDDTFPGEVSPVADGNEADAIPVYISDGDRFIKIFPFDLCEKGVFYAAAYAASFVGMHVVALRKFNVRPYNNCPTGLFRQFHVSVR